jgi:hypothetical protein
MARYEDARTISMIAGEALTMARFVNVQTDETVDMADVAGDIPLGICAETVVVGDVAPIAYSGVGYIELGATVAAGAMVSAGTDGVGVAASVITDEHMVGPLLQGGDDGDIVAIMINIRSVDAIV